MNLKNLTIAHRGIFNNINTPENSLKSIKKAMDLNLPIELDVTLTKDKKLIVFHDINLKRMCNLNKYVDDMTLNEIKKLTLLSTNEKIPTLEEVLNLVNGKVLLDIEIKSNNNTKLICNTILKTLEKYQGDLLLKSFQPKIVRYLKKNSSYTIGLLITNFLNHKIYSYIMSCKFLINYCNPDFLAINKKIIKKKRIQNYRKKLPIFIWTITNKDEQNNFSKFADSFLCNNLPYL